MLSVMACRLLGRLRQEGNLNLGVRDQFVQCRVTLSLKNTHTQLKVNERLKNKT
jgi:flagellar basal body-associated protein FliL